MHQTNWYDVIPFFMTTSGYGVLMNFCCHATKTSPLNFTASFLNTSCWDYYFFYGPQFDTIIAGYRTVAGQAPMLPKWAYGFWQCKNRYTAADSIVTAVSTFRKDSIPVDNIVQDWYWWTNTGSFSGLPAIRHRPRQCGSIASTSKTATLPCRYGRNSHRVPQRIPP